MNEITNPAQKEVWDIVRRINAAWLDNQPEKLLELFHDRMVIVGSGGNRYGEGKDLCVDSYRSFIQSAKIAHFHETDPRVDVFDTVAIVSYGFEIEYTMDNKTLREGGRDTFVLERFGGQWLAVWRQMVDQPAS